MSKSRRAGQWPEKAALASRAYGNRLYGAFATPRHPPVGPPRLSSIFWRWAAFSTERKLSSLWG